ncbi:MAG: glycosyltransferase family 4 protein, partial [Anaerolineae bacterium]
MFNRSIHPAICDLHCSSRNRLDADRMSNLLILNGDLPIFPGRAGHEYLHTTHLTQLARQVGLVSLVHTREQDEKKQGLANAGVMLYLWESPHLTGSSPAPPVRRSAARRIGKSLLQALQCGVSRPRDTLIEDFQFRNLSGPLLKALEDETWHVLVIVQSKCARWLDYMPRFPVSVLVMHDVRARLYERRAQTAVSLLERLNLWLEAWRYRRFEYKYCRKFDLVVTVSSADEAWVREHYRPTRLVTVPIPVDGDYFAPMPDVCEASARILFTGMMDHPPNVDAACFFAREVLPRVQRVVPAAEFWIVGRDPAPQVRALAGLPGVVVTGFVSDIRPYIAQATIVVVPLRFGSGMRNKILEAWAMQKCVVSTTVGAEGLDYRDGENILIADSAESMAARVVEILRDPERRKRIGAQGRQIIKMQHEPERLAQHYYQAIASVVCEKQQQDEPMRVAIDLRWMHPGVAGGIENLSRSFIKHLLLLDRYNCYTLLV